MGALLLAAPAFRTSEERIDTLCPAVREAAERVGRSMGFSVDRLQAGGAYFLIHTVEFAARMVFASGTEANTTSAPSGSA